MAATRRIEAAHVKMGAVPTWSCAPYHIGVAPSFGQQFASAESNVICYYNSIIGARTNRYAGPLELLCGIAGRAPYFGLHVPENRYAQGLVKLGADIKPEYFQEEDIYNLVSYAYGSIVADRVWALEGVPAKGMTNEILKQFSATAASSGGIALFQITNPDVTDIDAVVLGCPHCSYNECAHVEELLRGRRVNDHVKFWLITARSVLDRLKDSGLYERLIRLGVEIYCDGCILEYRNKNLGTNTMMSNSGKFDTYCFAMRGLQPVFGSMRECIESAVAGKVVKEAKPWRK